MATNKRLSATITIGGAISGTLKAAFGDVNKSLGKIGQTVTDLTKRQKLLGRAIQEFGRAGKDVDGMRSRYARLTEQLDRARRAQERLTKAQAFKTKAGEIGGTLKGAAVRTGAAGAAIGGILYTGISAAKKQQNEEARIRALGFNQHDSDELIKTAKEQRAFGVSTKDATETARDLASAFGDVHHAVEALPIALKQRFALGLYDQEHGTQLAEHAAYAMAKVIELRNGTKDMAEYNKQANMAHQVLVATGGRITGEEMQHAIRTGGIAAKSMTDEAFYYGGSHLMQEMGGDTFGTASMSLYQALAQGRVTKRAAQNLEKFGLIGDPSKVKHDKAGQMSFMNPGALLGYDTFVKDPQAWVEKYFIPTLRKHGINPDDMTKVAEVAGSIISNRTGANMLATRVAQRQVIAKEAANAARADNIDQGAARQRETAAGKEANAEARLADLRTKVGTQLMPIYIRALEMTASALEKVNAFAEKNPELFKAVSVGLAGTAAALIVVTPLLLAANGVLQTIALIRLARATAEVTSMVGALNGVQGAAASAAGGVLGFIGKLGMAAGLASVALAAAKAAGLPDTDAAKGIDDVKNGRWWAASAHLDAGSFLRAGAAKISGKSNEEIAASLANGKNPSELGAPPTVPPMATARSAAPVVNSNDSYTFNIMQQAGQDQKALADEIIRRMDQQKRVQNRSIMFDGASQ
jgi:hypothetical protein